MKFTRLERKQKIADILVEKTMPHPQYDQYERGSFRAGVLNALQYVEDQNKKTETRRGYMDYVDWLHHLGIGNDPSGTEVWGSKEWLKKEKKCVRSCGICLVEVKFIRMVEKGKDERRTTTQSRNRKNSDRAGKKRSRTSKRRG